MVRFFGWLVNLLRAQGGLEGCKPSKNHSFLVLFVGFADK
jgi:hypothetical protein